MLDDICGSSSLGASVDSIFVLREEGRNIVFKTGGQRYSAKIDDTVLTFDKERRSFAVAGTREELTSIRSKNKQELLEEAIVSFVVQSPGCLLAEIKSNVASSGKAHADAMRSLRSTGRLRVEGPGRAGSPYRYFAAIPEESVAPATQSSKA